MRRAFCVRVVAAALKLQVQALLVLSLMVQTKPQLLTVEDFIARYGDDSRYELIDGELIDLDPTGPHEEVAAFISRKLNVAIEMKDAN